MICWSEFDSSRIHSERDVALSSFARCRVGCRFDWRITTRDEAASGKQFLFLGGPPVPERVSWRGGCRWCLFDYDDLGMTAAFREDVGEEETQLGGAGGGKTRLDGCAHGAKENAIDLAGTGAQDESC